jgi:hypothetical protein
LILYRELRSNARDVFNNNRTVVGMPFRKYQSVYTPEELAQLTGVLAEALRKCLGDDEDLPEAEFDELQTMLAKIIIAQYKGGERDLERLKAIVLDRAGYYGYCVEIA